MPFISRRAMAEQAAAMTRLRDALRTAEAAELVQAGANARLARALELTEATTANVASAYRVGRRELLAENQRLRAALHRTAKTS